MAEELPEFEAALDKLAEEHDVIVVDQLLRKVAERGLFVNNLFQMPETDQWRCSLFRQTVEGEYSRDDMYEYGDGDCAEDAIINALYNAHVVENYSQMVVRKKLRRTRCKT